MMFALAAYLLWPSLGERRVPQTGQSSQKSVHLRNRARHHTRGQIGEDAQSVALDGMENEEQPTELAVIVKDDEQFLAMLEAARKAGVLLSNMRALRAVRLRGTSAKLKRLLSDDAFSELVVYENHIEWLIPEYDEDELSASSGRPFGTRALRWLGIDETAENRGKGVKIVVLDTAIDASAPSLEGVSIQEQDLFGLGKASEKATSLHGTMVASILAGDNGVVGCVPSASILSIPVMNAAGYGSSHDVAQAIVAAVDGGAQIITMSMGFTQGDALLEMAVDYATSKGVLIVAAAGNEGSATAGESTILYPAAYKGVLAVGAVNADSLRPEFSSTGTELALVAPGVGLLADDGSDYVMFSGTSASVPCVTGSLAYLMSSKEEVSATKAAELLLENANDMGEPADDVEYGLGGVSVERALNADTPGIFDAAAADVAVVKNAAGHVESVYFTAQNRGTEEVERMTLVCTLTDALTGKTVYSEEKVFENVPVGGSVSVVLSDGEFSDKLSASVEVRSAEDFNNHNNRVRRSFEVVHPSSEK